MKQKIQKYISDWQKKCYKDGIPDQAPLRLEQLDKVPSYRILVKAILKNDVTLKSLGFIEKKCNMYHHLKRVELENRNPTKQTKLF